MAIWVVFTGKLSRDRARMEVEAQQLGFIVDKKVVAGIHYLVVGQRPGKTKMQAAQRFGVKQISEAEYRQMAAKMGQGPGAASPVPQEKKAETPVQASRKPKADQAPPAWLEKLRKAPGVVTF